MAWQRFLNSQNWNIGFFVDTPNDIVKYGKLSEIQWMKHPYKDRFFADPFILKVSDREITIFVEELEFNNPKGRLVELVVDKESKKLLRRHVLLDIDTHLSYPIIYRMNNKIYVCPENGASGELVLYEYNSVRHILEYCNVIINEALADATIYQIKNKYYMFATKVPNTQEDLYLYVSDKFECGYKEVKMICEGRKNARPAGNLFEINGKLYRPAQNCVGGYGKGIEIMELLECGDKYDEKNVCSLKPISFRYNIGIHTINFHNGMGVIDGYGYLYPFIGRILMLVRMVKHYFFKNGK